ncbi:transporter substrate-binding domain-containing protein [Alsobacter sp. SYSU M60028]|uniref:Transporter substrate-binding domain-containing protein n=1 Tax=Alsobacter ponti TaxID=2962936 RepID=A0ABT1LFW5_9HYPH|nr:transporter substrate-binding domain-containing protein [Alsobacter ponti]MCP8940390.1 transporter substrate-binding domain-containing protein [Alsobacter ponti]
MEHEEGRRGFLKLGTAGLAVAGVAAAATVTATAQKAAAQAAGNSVLRTVLDRGKLIVGTGSTNAPWHFENEKGELVGMDITMARILAKGLFDDATKVEFVRQDPAQRIPNITTGKVDIVIQFMTVTPQRAQLVAFTRPYYVEGIALLTRPDAANKSFDQLLAGAANTKVSILQNVDAERSVHEVLPKAQVMQIDTQANVIQALESKRADAAAIDLSTVRWLVAKNPNRYSDSGKKWFSMLYAAALRQGDPDWLNFVNTTFNVAMYGHQNELYDAAFKEYFGLDAPTRTPGFPSI